MIRLPVIVGLGGVNAAGRSTFHHAYSRMVVDALPVSVSKQSYQSLSKLMNLDPALSEREVTQLIDSRTLVRRLDKLLFDVDRIPYNKRLRVNSSNDSIIIECSSSQLPPTLPPSWSVIHLHDGRVKLRIDDIDSLILPMTYGSKVKATGQLPTGFDLGGLYQSRHHPRGLQMTVFGASDAVQSMGIHWETIQRYVSPDHISVYAGSAMGQLDMYGTGGMLMSRQMGKPVSPKQCPLGFAQMPADFINAYILGSVGHTGTSMGACASFLYNLHQAVTDIKSGRARVALVGNSEAPLTPEIIEGYASMGALATDDNLLALDSHLELTEPDYSRACRPFSSNCGFVLGESSQFIVLCDDALAMELGATIYGAVGDVFINADGHKKSIAAPGVGNYITMAKAVASARMIVGDQSIRQRSYIQAHGSGTPQNRVTESDILDMVAKAFDINNWPVCAVKSYLGHSLGAAAGDQIAASLGVWEHGIIPGIKTIDHVANDVHADRLDISQEHKTVGKDGMDVAFINAKGFGGNNASAVLLAPHLVRRMLVARFGNNKLHRYLRRNEEVCKVSEAYHNDILSGRAKPIYNFDHRVRSGEHIQIDRDAIHIEGYDQAIRIDEPSPYSGLLD